MRLTVGGQEDVLCPPVSVTLGMMAVALVPLLPFPVVEGTRTGFLRLGSLWLVEGLTAAESASGNAI